MMKCPVCGLVAQDAMGNVDKRMQAPPVGAIVICECGSVNRCESTGDALLNALGARNLRTLSAAEFEALPADQRAALDQSIARFKAVGRYRGRGDDLDTCKHCGHARRQHLDQRWNCNLGLCSCPGFELGKAATT